MTNVTVVFEYEEPEYCRLCLAEATDDNELSTIGESCISDEDDITQVIRTLLQIELDPAKDANSFICSTCLESLEEFYRYRSQCRQHNVTLKKEAIERKQKQIDLAKNAIENTNVLDQVCEGEPIKVIIRMNSEGKASVRIQVQSKAHDNPSKDNEKTNAVDVGTKSKNEPTISLIEKQSPKTAPTQSETATNVENVKNPPGKLIRLPSHQFYFYKTNEGFGLIYGGYRYYCSIPRKSRTYWVCEQRNTHNCQTLFLADKAYVVFHLNWGHNHDPPKVRDNLIIYKSCDVLHKVIQRDRVREQEINKTQQMKSNTAIEPDSQVKQETSDSEDDESQDVLSDVDADEVLSMEVEVKEEPGLNEQSQSSDSSHVQIDAGENMYFIQELT
ncbi:uncharacterized protein LOC131688898 [Topomyia yanbarensis]|uniref:uncharacterized protein LOC131688898 n=1 Tax=Topomyia yanbarensis TaxID=2498891 RepID=UPI00273BE03B|nr:uncharacterized protein LOC131688898 [Topomyia yanbarensis]